MKENEKINRLIVNRYAVFEDDVWIDGVKFEQYLLIYPGTRKRNFAIYAPVE